MAKATIHVCRVETPDGTKDLVTLLPPESFFADGLVPEAVIGTCLRPVATGEAIRPDNFARNPEFVEFMHGLIAAQGPQLPGLRAEARRQGDGWVYLIDGRTRTPQGSVPPHDVIGVFQVENGLIVAGSYRGNPNHRILSEDGFFQLPADLQELLLAELLRRNRERGAAGATP
jgi:hypothetical protein